MKMSRLLTIAIGTDILSLQLQHLLQRSNNMKIDWLKLFFILKAIEAQI